MKRRFGNNGFSHGPVDESKVRVKKEGNEFKNVFGSSQIRPNVAKPFWERGPQYLEEGQLKPTKYEAVNLKDRNPEQMNKLLHAYTDGERVTKTHFHL